MSNAVFSIALAGQSPGSTTSYCAAAPGAFLVGPENPLLPVVARFWCEPDPAGNDSQVSYNPLVIYGPASSGKSHLARGLVRQFCQRLGAHSKDACYELTGHEFAQDYARAVDRKRVAEWREELRSCALLLVEDVEPLAAKAPAQQELIATIDALLDGGGHVIVTSRKAPRELTELSPMLRSRLTAGLEMPLAAPGLLTRLALLRHYASIRRLPLSAEALELLAAGLEVSAAELLGTLTSLEIACRTQGTWQTEGISLDAQAVRRHLQQQAQERRPAVVSLRGIALATARYFGLKLHDLKSASRERPTVTARCVAMYLARQLTPQTLEQIGKYLGGRDHTTVLHGCRRVVELMQTDPATRQAVADLQARLAAS